MCIRDRYENARLVEHAPRVLVRLEPREREPHVHGVGHALDGAAEHDARVLDVLVLETAAGSASEHLPAAYAGLFAGKSSGA